MNEAVTDMHEYDNLPSIELATPTDAEAIFDVQRRSWLATYPNAEAGISEEDIRLRIEGENGELIPQKIEMWRKSIETQGDQGATYVARENGEVVGFTTPTIRDGQRRIGAIYLLPEIQGKGIGSRLLAQAIAWFGREKDIYLHVANYNRNAIEFYKKHGFEETATELRDEVALCRGTKEIPQIEMVLRAATM